MWRVRSGVCGTAVAMPMMAPMCLPVSRTQEALKSGHFVDVLSILLRLQRICNHPGLVEPRLPESSYTAGPLQYRSASLVLKALDGDFWKVRAHLASHRCAVASAAPEAALRAHPAVGALWAPGSYLQVLGVCPQLARGGRPWLEDCRGGVLSISGAAGAWEIAPACGVFVGLRVRPVADTCGVLSKHHHGLLSCL